MPRQKRDFKGDNPALTFLSSQGAIPATPPHRSSASTALKVPQEEPSTGREPKRQALLDGARSKRFSMAVQPSLYEDLELAAILGRTNINDLCNKILTEYIDSNQEKIERFREMSKEFFD